MKHPLMPAFKERNTTLKPAKHLLPVVFYQPVFFFSSTYSHSTLQPQLILPIISLIEARGALRMHTHWARPPAGEDRRQGEELPKLPIYCALFMLPDCKLSSSPKNTLYWQRVVETDGENPTFNTPREVWICLLCVSACVRERDVMGILSAAKSVFPERVKAKGQMGCEMVRGARRETHNTKNGINGTKG